MAGFVESLLKADDDGGAAARWTRLGRSAAAATVLLGATFQVLTFATIPEFDKTADRLAWIADHDGQAQLSKVFDILAMPFLVGAAIVYLLLSRSRAPRLAWAGGALLVTGMVGLSMVQGAETIMFALASDRRFDLAALADAFDGISNPSAIAMFVLFLPGAFFGVLLTSAALWRSRAVPRGAVILLLAFLVTDIALQRGLLGHAMALAAAVWIALTILRAPSRCAPGTAPAGGYTPSASPT
jgi:hypothetical protein